MRLIQRAWNVESSIKHFYSFFFHRFDQSHEWWVKERQTILSNINILLSSNKSIDNLIVVKTWHAIEVIFLFDLLQLVLLLRISAFHRQDTLIFTFIHNVLWFDLSFSDPLNLYYQLCSPESQFGCDVSKLLTRENNRPLSTRPEQNNCSTLFFYSLVILYLAFYQFHWIHFRTYTI